MVRGMKEGEMGMSEAARNKWDIATEADLDGYYITDYLNDEICRNIPNIEIAQLLLAAPDLLDALEGMVDLCKHWAISGGNIDKAISAIAKARGHS